MCAGISEVPFSIPSPGLYECTQFEVRHWVSPMTNLFFHQDILSMNDYHKFKTMAKVYQEMEPSSRICEVEFHENTVGGKDQPFGYLYLQGNPDFKEPKTPHPSTSPSDDASPVTMFQWNLPESATFDESIEVLKRIFEPIPEEVKTKLFTYLSYRDMMFMDFEYHHGGTGHIAECERNLARELIRPAVYEVAKYNLSKLPEVLSENSEQITIKLGDLPLWTLSVMDTWYHFVKSCLCENYSSILSTDTSASTEGARLIANTAPDYINNIKEKVLLRHMFDPSDPFEAFDSIAVLIDLRNALKEFSDGEKFASDMVQRMIKRHQDTIYQHNMKDSF